MLAFLNFDKKKHQLKWGFAIFLAGILIFAFGSCHQSLDRNAIIEQKVESLLAKMTLDEKIGQMSLVRHFDGDIESDIVNKFLGSILHSQGPLPGENAAGWQARFKTLQEKALSTRLGIPLLIGVDAIHGQNTFEGATIFPHNIGMGASRNELLVEEAAAITAIEMQATGFNWTFAPCIAIPYNEKWGRVYEAFSESTEMTSKLVKASVRGHQGNLSDNTTVMATAKHFIGDGSTDFGREGGNTTMCMQEVSERLLPSYRAAVNEGVGAIMVSFNSLSGITMHAHKELIMDTLKTSWGFDGIVVTDWRGFSRFGENDIINAGVDVVMAVEGDLNQFQKELKDGVNSGEVSQARVDDAVRRILRQKFRLGLFEHPFADSSLVSKIGCKTHRDKARQAVRESMVLLKNENNVLPISKSTHKIVVVGEHANNSGLQSGGWSIAWQGTHENYAGATTILEGIQDNASGSVIYDELSGLDIYYIYATDAFFNFFEQRKIAEGCGFPHFREANKCQRTIKVHATCKTGQAYDFCFFIGFQVEAHQAAPARLEHPQLIIVPAWRVGHRKLVEKDFVLSYIHQKSAIALVVAPSACGVSFTECRYKTWQAVYQGHAVEVAAVFGCQGSDEMRVPLRDETVVVIESTQARKAGIYSPKRIVLSPGHFVDVDGSGV